MSEPYYVDIDELEIIPINTPEQRGALWDKIRYGLTVHQRKYQGTDSQYVFRTQIEAKRFLRTTMEERIAVNTEALQKARHEVAVQKRIVDNAEALQKARDEVKGQKLLLKAKKKKLARIPV